MPLHLMNFCHAGIKISCITNLTTIDCQHYLVSKEEIIHLNDSKKTKMQFRVTSGHFILISQR